ncbi:MAG: PorT family protein [Calditrichaeota bacterium]|nr:MAG: PorT family protein [Calditrichota bacterium]
MKKTTIALLLMVFGFSDVQGQSIKGFGFKAGGTRAKQIWTWDQVHDFQKKPRLGMAVGTFVELRAMPRFSANLEAFYIQKGFEEQSVYASKTTDGETTTYRPRVDYLSFLLLAKFALTEDIEAYLLCGPRVDIEISRNDVAVYHQIYDNLQAIDVGGSIGFGVKSPEMHSMHVLLEMRYSPSARQIFNDKIMDENVTVKNQSLEFLMGFEF